MSRLSLWCAALLICLLNTAVLTAQRYDYIWYFGYNAGIDFRSGAAVVINDGQLWTSEGSAVATDPLTRNLVFYTDGVSVWDSTHQKLNIGALNGDVSSTQAAVIVPVPGYHRRYYIFTNAAAEGRALTVGVQYTILDFHQANPVLAQNVPLLAPGTEKLTAVGGCDGERFWIITHEGNSDRFHAYSLTSQGLNTTAVVSSVGPVLMDWDFAGYLTASPSGTMLGMACYRSSRVTLFSFDKSTGVVSAPIPLPRLGTPYGVCFSPDGSKLYASSQSFQPQWNGIAQFDVSTYDSAAVVASYTVLRSSVWQVSAIEPGPDGRLYIAEASTPRLGVIDFPNLAGTACNYRSSGLVLGARSAALGLPNVVVFATPSDKGNLGLGDDKRLCAGQQVQLSASGADRYQWSPAAGLSCTNCPDPIVSSDTTITYILTGFIDSGCIGTVFDTITLHIADTGLAVDARGEQRICPGSEALLVADVDSSAYILWSSSSDPVPCDTCHLLRVRPARTTTYYLAAWMRGGCTGRDSVTVIVDPNALKIDAGGGGVICPGGSVPIGVDAPPGSQILWNPWGTLDCDTCATTEARPTRTTMYYVDVFDSTGCRGRDSVLVIVDTAAIPVDVLGGTAICPGESATLSISPFLSAFHIKWSPAVSCDTCTEVEVHPTTTTVYTVEVWDDRGCRGSDTVTVEVKPLVSPNAQGGGLRCTGDSAVLRVDVVPGARVKWSPSAGLGCDTCATTAASPTATTTYRVEVVSDEVCYTPDSVQVTIDSNGLPVELRGTKSICPGGVALLEVNAPSGVHIQWYSSNGSVPCDTCRENLLQPSSTTTYWVECWSDAGCRGRDTFTVSVSANGLAIDAGANDTICAGDAATLVADVPPTARLKWSPSAGLACDTCATTEARPTSTTVYRLTAVDTSGCEGEDSVEITLRSAVPLSIAGGGALCRGDSLLLSVVVPAGERVKWSPSAGLSCDTCPTTVARPTVTTVYRVEVVDGGGCSAPDSVEVVVRTSSVLTVVGGGSICRGDSATLSVVVPPGSRVRWTPSTGLSCDTCPTTVARPTTTTTYRAELLNPSPCDAPGSVQVEVRAPVVVVVELGDAVLRPGTPATLPVRLRGLPAGTSISEIKLGVRYDPSMLRLESASGSGSLSDWVALNADDRWRDGWYSAQFRSPFGGVLQSDGEVLELEFGSYYGGKELSSVVAVEELELTGLSCMEVSGVGGGVRLDSLCWALMRGVELSPFGSDKVVGVYPSPAREEVGVVLNVGEAKEVELVAVDAAGVEHRLGGGQLVGGEHELVVGVSGLSSGWYRMVVRDGSRVIGSRLLLVIH